MKSYQIGTMLGLTLVTMIAFQNCAQQGALTARNQATSDSGEMRKSMDDLALQIRTLSAQDLSCASDADCTMIAVGAAHCGSPTFSVVGSKNNANFSSVIGLSKQFRDIEKNYNSANQIVGTCEAPQYAAPRCVSNRCQVAFPGQ